MSSLIPNASQRRDETSPQPLVDEQRVLQIPIGLVTTNPRQPRKGIDHSALEDLINSIRQHGILQPLVVVKVDKGYQLIAGERRYRSAQIIGMKTVPAIVRDATTQEQLELAIVENVQRKDLNPMERASAYRKLIDEFGLTQEQVAKRVGKSRVTVANALRLLDLPEEVREAIISEKITEGHAKVIASAVTPKEQLKLLAEILKGSLSVRSGEKLAHAARGSRRHPGDPELIAAEEELRDRFNTRVRIDRRGKLGAITIEYYSDEEYRALLQRLRRA